MAAPEDAEDGNRRRKHHDTQNVEDDGHVDSIDVRLQSNEHWNAPPTDREWLDQLNVLTSLAITISFSLSASRLREHFTVGVRGATCVYAPTAQTSNTNTIYTY